MTDNNMSVHYSSERDDWATPWDLFADLDAEFDFTLDPYATADSAKCVRYYTREDDGLAQSWAGERVFMNPPYGRSIGRWIAKAASGEAELVCCLLPARTDTRWFHEHIYQREGVEVRFLKGRIQFDGTAAGAPFPSMVVIFRQ